MSEPMSEAEQAVVDVLEGDSACTWHQGCDVEDCYGPRAAAIVAKLRPLLAAEIEALATKLRSGFPDGPGGDTESYIRGIETAARLTREGRRDADPA